MKPVVVRQQVMSFSLAVVLLLALFAPASVAAQTMAPAATVVSAGLNVRSGPGVGYSRAGVVTRNTVLPVVGQAQNCAWLQVTLADGSTGWVSGGARYTRLNVPCSAIPAASAGSAVTQPPAPSAPVPAATSVPAAPTATPSPAPATTPAPAPTAAAEAEALPPGFGPGPLPGDQACYLVQNYVGPELTVTFTNQDSGQSTDFRVPSSGEVLKCITPGRYTVTADAPPPWGTLNFSFTAFAGEREYMPFYGRP